LRLNGGRTPHVAIVGGGIAGLATAYYLQQAAALQGIPLAYSLLEQSSRWGGKIRTDEVAGHAAEPFVVEGGPDSFITQKPWALQLARELGLEANLLATNDQHRQVFVLHHGRPVPLPEGVLMIVPTKIGPFARSPLISPLGKLRMGLDLLVPARRDGIDETLAEFVTRRLGAEALDKIAEPLMSGIYNAEAERQSLLATFPRFRDLEMKHGSLIRGMVASRRAGQRPSPSTNGHKPLSLFVSLTGGMEALVRALDGRLMGARRLNATAEGLRREAGGRYTLTLRGGERLDADAVILAVPAYVAARLVADLAPAAAAGLEAIRYVSTGTVSLGYRAADVPHPLNGFGLVIPRSEGRPINAITWTSTKFERRAPAGHELLRVFFGGSRHPEMVAVPDDELLQVVGRELRQILGLEARPLFNRIYRWHRANPQYDVGHLDRVAAIEAALPEGLFVTGSPYRGIGVPDCVHQAQETAGRLMETIVRPVAI
jgi:oxygen-dependent protoporphyrinogen oxidase